MLHSDPTVMHVFPSRQEVLPVNQAQTPSLTPPRLTGALAGSIVVGTLLLALPRFAHTTPDSIYYTDLLRYFQGDLDRAALQTPFAFRFLVPWVAAWLPLPSPAIAIATCSMVATCSAYLLAVRLWANFLETQRQLHVAALLLVCSFPTVNYGSAVMTDAAGFLVVTAACLALYHHADLVLGLLLVLGSGVRESTLLMLPVMALYFAQTRRPGWLPALGIISVSTLLAAGATRGYFADLPPYFWTPSWGRMMDNLSRPVSWATVTLTMGPLLVLFVLPTSKGPPPVALRQFVVSLALPCLALFVYGVTSAFMSGRFLWPLYLALVPLVAWRVSRETA